LIIILYYYFIIDIFNINFFFYNSSLRSNFFGEDSNYEFSNVIFDDIKANSKTIINVMNKDISLKNCQFNKILLNGDVDNNSLINFYSNNNILHMDNILINDVMSNGDLITIDGISPNVQFYNTQMNNTSNYGSLLYNKALNVCI